MIPFVAQSVEKWVLGGLAQGYGFRDHGRGSAKNRTGLNFTKMGVPCDLQSLQ